MLAGGAPYVVGGYDAGAGAGDGAGYMGAGGTGEDTGGAPALDGAAAGGGA